VKHDFLTVGSIHITLFDIKSVDESTEARVHADGHQKYHKDLFKHIR